MLERKAFNKLVEWKNKKDKMCLIVRGARQVGKTYIIEKFGKDYYDNYISINFLEKESYKEIFEGDLDVDTIIKQLTLRLSCNIEPGKTLIFLDEIQNCPRAITALKFFSIDKRYDVIASGSLLGISYKETSYPVGYVEHMQMFPLDFEEFCWANGISKENIADLKTYYDNKKEVPIFTHNKMMELFKEYIVVGGMPQVVDNYVINHDFSAVLTIQKDIITARECFLSIPKHLAKDYKKFRYNLVEPNANARKYQGSLAWLYDAGIINYCHNLSIPETPLEGNARDDAFKVYMCDTGLLVAMLEDGSQNEIINGNLGIYKGAIYENIIADIFTKSGKKLYYFEHNSTLEVDFIIKYDNKVCAVEVKSAENTKSKSLNSLLTNWNVPMGIKLSSKNIGYNNNILTLPLYMAIFI